MHNFFGKEQVNTLRIILKVILVMANQIEDFVI
jgi:hypothetical protein